MISRIICTHSVNSYKNDNELFVWHRGGWVFKIVMISGCDFYHADMSVASFATAKKFCCRSILGIDIDSGKIVINLGVNSLRLISELCFFI